MEDKYPTLNKATEFNLSKIMWPSQYQFHLAMKTEFYTRQDCIERSSKSGIELEEKMSCSL